MSNLQFWHGSQRWTGHPKLNPSRPGCYECGPGLYLTTGVETARKYSGGSGKTMLIEVAADIKLLEDSYLSAQEMRDAIASLPRVKNRRGLMADLEDCFKRYPSNRVPAACLVNLCVNNESIGGQSGPALAKWLAEKGIDASLTSAYGQEEWLIVFNLEKIKKFRAVAPSEAWEVGNQPFYKAQLAQINNSPEVVKKENTNPLRM